jgi:hypothetical protein
MIPFEVMRLTTFKILFDPNQEKWLVDPVYLHPN